MKAVLVVGVLVTSVLGLPTDSYRADFDRVNVDDVLSNSRMYQKYFQCLTDEGRCTSDGIILKGMLTDALSNGCTKCSDKQKNVLQKIFRFMINEKADDFDVLEKIYDPEGNFRKKYID